MRANRSPERSPFPGSAHWFFRKMMTGTLPLAPVRVPVGVPVRVTVPVARAVGAAVAGPAAETPASVSAVQTPADTSAPEMTLPLPRIQLSPVAAVERMAAALQRRPSPLRNATMRRLRVTICESPETRRPERDIFPAQA